MNWRVAIRVDASPTGGLAQVMRCLTLADALARQNASVQFVCHDQPGELNALIAARGYPASCLITPPDAQTPQVDAEQTLQALGPEMFDWLIVDHYAFDADWERRFRPMARHIMAIDDLANRPHDVDLLLDQNLYADMSTRYHDLLAQGTHTRFGPRYALLNQAFAVCREQWRLADQVRQIVIRFDGGDPTNQTSMALHALQSFWRSDMQVTVVTHPANPQRAAIEAACGGWAHCLGPVAEHAPLLAQADLVIGSGNFWEHAALGLPSLVVSTAPDQTPIARHLADHNAIFYLGEAESGTAAQYATALQRLLGDAELRAQLSTNARRWVDGRGTPRLLAAMQAISGGWQAVDLRPACWDDAADLFAWRNAEVTRRFFIDPRPVPWDAHCAWLKLTLSDPDALLCIGEAGGAAIGVLRYNRVAADTCKISVYLVPDRHHQGWGSALISAGNVWLQECWPAMRRIEALVLKDNVASRRAFTKARFVLHHSGAESDQLHHILNPEFPLGGALRLRER